MSSVQQQMAIVAPLARDILRQGKREDVTVKIALRGLGLPSSFLAALDNDTEDYDILREIYLRFHVENTYDEDRGLDHMFEVIAKDLGGAVTASRVKQVHTLVCACFTRTLAGKEQLDDFEVQVSRLQAVKENQWVTLDNGDKIMVCPHFKEFCAACKTDLRLDNQSGSRTVQRAQKSVKKEQRGAEEQLEWRAFLTQLQQNTEEQWKYEAATLFDRIVGAQPGSADANLTNSKIADRLKMSEKQVKSFRQKYNAKRKKVFSTPVGEAPALHLDGEDEEKTEEDVSCKETGDVRSIAVATKSESQTPARLEQRPFVSSRTDISHYLKDFPSQLVSMELLSAESVDQIVVKRHTEEEVYYDIRLREYGRAPKVDDDIVEDALLAARLTNSPLLFVMLELVFGKRIECLVGVEDKILASEVLSAYYYGVGSFFEALYVQEEPARKKQLWRKAANNFGKVVLELEGDPGRRLRSVWYLFRMLRLIVHNDKLDRYLDHIRKQLAETLELKTSNKKKGKEAHADTAPPTLESRLVHLHVVLHFAKLKFESHLRSDALLGFQQAEMLLEKLLAEHPDATTLLLPGGEKPAKRTPLEFMMENRTETGGSVVLDKAPQRDLRDYRCALHIVQLHLAVLYKEARDFGRSYEYFNRLEKALNPPPFGYGERGETEQMYVGVQNAAKVVGRRSWSGMVRMPGFFENSHVPFHFEQSYILERYRAFVALGRCQLAHLWIDHHFGWSKQYAKPKMLRAYADFICNPTRSRLEPSFRRTFDENFKPDFDTVMDQMETKLAGGEAAEEIYSNEPRKINPVENDVLSKMYFDLLAEEALRQEDYVACVRAAERKLTFLGGEWDRVACYLILRACLEMADRVEGAKLGQEKLKKLRLDYPGQMRYHEYFFVLYLENELTTCSDDGSDRVLFRINKFKKQFPRMVAMSNIKQSRDFFAAYQAESEHQLHKASSSSSTAMSRKGKVALARAVELARRATKYSEGRLWLAALQTATSLPDDLAKISLTAEDHLDLLCACQMNMLDGAVECKHAAAGAAAEDGDDGELTVQELAEQLAACKDSLSFRTRLATLIDLEQRNARPDIDLEGNHRLPALVPEHYVWQNFDPAIWPEFAKRKKYQFVDLPRRREDHMAGAADGAGGDAAPAGGGGAATGRKSGGSRMKNRRTDHLQDTTSSKTTTTSNSDFGSPKQGTSSSASPALVLTATEDPQAKVTTENVDAFAASVLEAGANDRTLFDISAFLEAGSKYFCVISNHQGIDKTRRLEFVRAIRKGFASKAKKSVGLKVDQHKLIKVKINGDHRLWTSTVFVNRFGKRLLVFRREDDHAGIERAKNATKANIQVARE
eukprot:g9179.t1